MQAAHIKLVIIASHSHRQDIPHGGGEKEERRNQQKDPYIYCHDLFCPPGCATLV